MGSGLFESGVDVLPDPTETIAGTQIPSWVSAAGQQLYGEAAELASSPYPAYTGPRIATYGTDASGNPLKLTADEREAHSILRDASTGYQPYLDAAWDATSNITESQPYIDIAQAAADPAIREIREQLERDQVTNRAAAARAGAFGGSRLGLREGETTGQAMQAMGDVRSRAAMQGLGLAQQRAAQMQTFAPLVQDLQQQAAAGLITAGEARRVLDQRALDMAYSDYTDQRQYPYQQLNFAMGALEGLPYDTSQYGMQLANQFMPQPSIYGQTIGALGTLGSAYALAKA
tara:strand:+ start:364 stop:1230 length:867 start_codon:yes stop_codon:yes gene_type:complete